MPLDQIANIAEILAAALVIVSLLYVGLQVKQNTAATHAAATQAVVGAINEVVGSINDSDKLADILHQGANGLSALKDGDLIRFMAFNDQAFLSFQSQYLQWKDGTLDERLWLTQQQAASDLLSQAGQHEWWAARRHWFFPEFQDYLDNLVGTEMSKPMHPGAVAG
jgi:hypothetical protein